ncbi:TonB-dependent receptor [Gallibacterium genomosp. 3]|uniref:TonB-dependent receptor n=1 Tax=Gallibacterium genomosp. 3 TaxID=505345 RepID=A0A1A7PLX6_9PAST|nr:TonB-dependent receptor [Gallibacterium genomosp. 3]OBX03538.1 TonB-dependent receptor [Gallibacterium genomosp. 3]
MKKHQKKLLWVTLCTVISPSLFANLADPDTIQPIKNFSPPKPIPPTQSQRYQIENQFDRTDRNQYYSVTDSINNGISPLKISSGIYGNSFYNSILSGMREANYYAIFNMNHSKANHYKSANGDKVDWGYTRFNQAIVLGWLPNHWSEYRFTLIHDDIEDDKQPQHQMDPINTDRLITRFNTRLGNEDLSNTLNAEVTYRKIKRHADNYTLRHNTPNVYMLIDREIYDVSLKYDRDFGQWHNMLGTSYQRDTHNGNRYVHTPNKDFLNGYRFADLHINRFRLFDELSYRINDQHKVALGITYENNQTQIHNANQRIPNPNNPALSFANPNQLWTLYFAQPVQGKVKQDMLSAELKYDFTPTPQQQYSFNVGHIERIGNNQERFSSVAAVVVKPDQSINNQKPQAAVVSNPWLKPEQHNRVKIDMDIKNEFYKGYLNSLMGAGWNIGGSLLYDDVKNLIIFDRVRHHTTQTNGGVISRNVNATLFLAQLYGNLNFAQHWGLGLKAQYTYGQNRTDRRPLYQTRPLEVTSNLDYKNYFRYGSYNLGIAMRYVAKQKRGDFDSHTGLGIDRYDAAKAFTVADLYAGINIKDKYGIRLGVNNLFNRQYAEFISGDHVMALAPSIVSAPGRTYWLSLHTSF